MPESVPPPVASQRRLHALTSIIAREPSVAAALEQAGPGGTPRST